MIPGAADPARWRRLSALLDDALDLSADDRAAWLEALASRDPDLVADLKAMLADHAASADARFLTGNVAPTSEDAAAAASLAGQALGAYTLERPIGQGGMGSVWLAHRSDGRYAGDVAVKLLNVSLIGRAGGERFKREGSILARLAHPHIARLIDAGVTGSGQPFLVLEYVEGERIDRHCDDAGLDVAARIRVFLDVLAAVAHSHANLIVHRDIKPANVLVAQGGAVKLLDFGIAKLLEESAPSGEATELTREGGRALTPEYAAPEQLLGEPVTTATDVYALGVLLYVLLGGQHPAGATSRSPAELVKTIVELPAQRLSEAVASTRTLPQNTLADNAARRSATPDKLQRLLRGDLDNIVAKALKKSPDERYPTVDAFADDLRRYLAHQPVSARADTFGYRLAKFTRRNRFSVAAGALAVVAVCAGLAGSLWQANEARQQRDRALALLDRSNAVTDFFEFLLTDAGPPDRPQTINSMLARSESLLRNEHSGNPEQQAAILLAQASYHVTVGDPGQAEPKLRRVLALLRDSSDGALRAEANCLQGFAVSMLGDVEAGVRDIEATLRDRRLPAFVIANCHQQMAFIAQNKGDGAATQRSAQAGLDVLKVAERPYPRLEASLLGDLAYGEQLQGRNDSAHRLYDQALAKLTAMGRDRSPLAVGIQNNWAIASLAAGDIKRALALYEQSARALRDRDPDGALPGYLSANLARALELMGRPEEALTIYRQAIAEAIRGNRLDTRLFGLLGSASAYCELGDVAHASQALVEARAAMEGAVPPGSPPALAADVVQGRIALLRGELEEAQRIFTSTLAAFEARKLANGSAVMLYLYRTEVALRRHRTDDALRDAQSALDMARRLQAGIPWSSRTGLAQLALADALRQGGRTEEARAALASALDHLGHALGEDHPTTQRALALQSVVRP
ncbi:MAG: serine/threonine-protein kinase [Caldimonas sp.]